MQFIQQWIRQKKKKNCASQIGTKIIYISTDYVFDGTKEGIYEEDDEVALINYYGYTKYLGEQEVKSIIIILLFFLGCLE